MNSESYLKELNDPTYQKPKVIRRQDETSDSKNPPAPHESEGA
jgi:hypothetical protein